MKKKNAWNNKGHFGELSMTSPTVSQECNDGPVDCFSKPGTYITHDATE